MAREVDFHFEFERILGCREETTTKHTEITVIFSITFTISPRLLYFISLHAFFGITLGLQPVGVQCPITSSLCEFPGYWDWLRYPGLPPVLVSIAFSLCLPYLGVFPFTLHLPLDFISVSSLLPTYLQSAPIEITSLTHFLSEFPDLGLALVHDVVVQEAEQRCA